MSQPYDRTRAIIQHPFRTKLSLNAITATEDNGIPQSRSSIIVIGLASFLKGQEGLRYAWKGQYRN